MPHNIINEPWCVSELAQMVSDFWRQTFLSDSLETKSLYLPWVLTPKRMSKHLMNFDWLRLIKRAVSCLVNTFRQRISRKHHLVGCNGSFRSLMLHLPAIAVVSFRPLRLHLADYSGCNMQFQASEASFDRR